MLTLNSRRQQHRLTLLKIHNLAPSYLVTLVSPLVGEISRYPLRNSDLCQTVDTKSQLYYNSFLRSVVREWNSIDTSARSSQSVASFKSVITPRSKVPSYYLAGNRKSQKLQTRFRTNCRSLNYCLFNKNQRPRLR